MLTAKQIESLPNGFIPNSFLRFKFGVKHGHVVKARYTRDGAEVDTDFIGNRSQYRFRLKNPFKALPDIEKPVYQTNKIEAKKKKNAIFLFFEYIKALIAKLK